MTAAALRQRRARARRKAGRVQLKIEVDEDLVSEALRLYSGFSESPEHRRRLLERRVAEVVETWAERWLSQRDR